ncbi:MAG: hypothetical protein JXI43_07780 [Tissierellales bacterium]|nr:hypothetical protein [Tissierellales bacterium]
MDNLLIDKLDVVRRQIKEAVRLFFEERDRVVIHTIIASAHQILFDIGKKSDVKSAVKNTMGLRNPEIQKYLKTINYPYNFFKHADRDPKAKINIGPLNRLTSDFIMDAIVMLQQLAENIPTEAKVYWFWFVSKYPQEFDNLPKDGEIAKMQSEGLTDWDFKTITQFLLFNDIMEEANKATSADEKNRAAD